MLFDKSFFHKEKVWSKHLKGFELPLDQTQAVHGQLSQMLQNKSNSSSVQHFWLPVSQRVSFCTFKQLTGNKVLLLTMKCIHSAQHRLCYSLGINFLTITCIFIFVLSPNLISIYLQMKQIYSTENKNPETLEFSIKAEVSKVHTWLCLTCSHLLESNQFLYFSILHGKIWLI